MQLDLNEIQERAEPLLIVAQERFKATQMTLTSYLSKTNGGSIVPSSTQ